MADALQQEVIDVTEEIDTTAECPDSQDKIHRVGCTASTPSTKKTLRIDVVRDDRGDLQVTTKLLDTFPFERRLLERLRITAPDRTMLDMECPKLVERKKGARSSAGGKGLLRTGAGGTRRVVSGTFGND